MRYAGFRFLLPYMAPYRWYLVLGMFYALISAASSALSPAPPGRAIDDLLAGVRFEALAGYAAGLVVLATLLAIFRRPCATTDGAPVGKCAEARERYAYAGGVFPGRCDDCGVSTRK